MITALTTNAMHALRTTISHCPRVTTGFRTGVSGEANAGTCNIRRTRVCHELFFPSACAPAPFGFSEIGDVDAGHATDGGRRVDAGDMGQADGGMGTAMGGSQGLSEAIGSALGELE